MKMKDIFEIETIDDQQFMVCLDSTVLAGMIQLNETAAFIVACLKEETTAEEIAGKMAATYDVSQKEALSGVEQIIAQLRQLNALEG